jgi:hypothetical protein
VSPPFLAPCLTIITITDARPSASVTILAATRFGAKAKARAMAKAGRTGWSDRHPSRWVVFLLLLEDRCHFFHETTVFNWEKEIHTQTNNSTTNTVLGLTTSNYSDIRFDTRVVKKKLSSLYINH